MDDCFPFCLLMQDRALISTAGSLAPSSLQLEWAVHRLCVTPCSSKRVTHVLCLWVQRVCSRLQRRVHCDFGEWQNRGHWSLSSPPWPQVSALMARCPHSILDLPPPPLPPPPSPRHLTTPFLVSAHACRQYQMASLGSFASSMAYTAVVMWKIFPIAPAQLVSPAGGIHSLCAAATSRLFLGTLLFNISS